MDAAVSDTDVISFVFKKDSRGEVYKSLLETRFILVLFMSLAELDRWSLAHHWGERRRAELAVFLDRFTVSFADRALCTAWAQATQSAREAGQPIACADAWIAATALRYQIPLITHNINHFRGVAGLTLLTPNG